MKKNLLLLAFLTLLFSSCEKDDLSIENEELNVTRTVKSVTLTKDKVLILNKLGIRVEGDSVQEVTTIIDGNKEVYITVEDLMFSYDDLAFWTKELNQQDGLKLRITRSRVDFPSNGKRTIKIGIVTSQFFEVSNKTKNAAITAIQRYQALNTNKLNFTYVTGSFADIVNDSSIDVRIMFDDFLDVFGRASYPSNGNPGRDLKIGPLAENALNQSQMTVLIQHEIGHTLGLIHGDFNTNRSCGGSAPQSLPGSIVFIPGTNSSGNLINTIMRSCDPWIYSNFRFEDRRSIRNAYSGMNF